jgi:hypothetical protein
MDKKIHIKTYLEFFFVVVLTFIMMELCAEIGTPLECGTLW